MNGTKIGNDLGQILVYANSITAHMTSTMLILSFFLLVLISSMMWAFKITGRIKLELHFAAAMFATLGFTVILTSIQDFISGIELGVVIGLTGVGILWLFLSNPTENY